MAERILFISLSNIGDAVMTTPVLQVLHATYPRAVIDIVADERSSELFRHCPFRGDILHKDKKRFMRGGPALLRQLRARHYDLAVDLRTDGLAWLLRANRKLTKRQGKPYGAHAVEQHMGVIRSLHGERPLPNSRIWLTKGLAEYAIKHLGHDRDQRLLGLGPGANWAGKIWPLASYIDLLNRLRGHFDGVILLGNRDDRERSARIVEQAAIPCRNFTGETSLLEAAAVLSRLAVFVGNDSGLGHMASAVDTATLTLFGPGKPAVYHPWGPRARWLVGEDQRIEKISVDRVVTTITHNMLQRN